jgi:hypothetical protein
MFTQACFIRKNTPELRKKLEDLGYKKSEFGSDLNNSIATTVSNDKQSYTCIREQSFDDTNPHTTWGFEFRIDCGDNEELFLALASLRDDNDVNQFFYYEGKIVVCVQDSSSTLNIYNDKLYKVKLFDNKNIFFEVPFKKLIKCTAEEIVGHFKSK